MEPRIARLHRITNETSIELSLSLDGTGKVDINTGIGFFDHMLNLFSTHALFDLSITCKGDLHVDGHHSVEDIGITLGKVFAEALGDKCGINRYGSFLLPMDETLASIAVDISGRPFLVYKVTDMKPSIGGYDTELTEEFLRAFAFNAGITLHIQILYGVNSHHKLEAIFKGLGHALSLAVTKNPRYNTVLSTKGIL